MGEFGPENPVQECTEQCTDNGDGHRPITSPQRDEERSRTGTCHSPPHAEDSSAEEVGFPTAGAVAIDVERQTSLGKPSPPFGQEVEDGAQHDCTADDAVHVEGLEPKHLVDAEPADHLPHGEGDAKESAEEENAHHVKEATRGGGAKGA